MPRVTSVPACSDDAPPAHELDPRTRVPACSGDPPPLTNMPHERANPCRGVVSVLPDSGAEKAGVSAGSIILKINGESVLSFRAWSLASVFRCGYVCSCCYYYSYYCFSVR
jgi:hypothetical protein